MAKQQEKAVPASPGDRYHRGISWNIYTPWDKLFLKDLVEQEAKRQGRSASEIVLGFIEEAVQKFKK
jgi:hypothetical protein